MQVRWLSSILAFLLALTPAAAQDPGLGGGYNIFGRGQRTVGQPAGLTVSLTRGTCSTETTNATTYNFTNVGTGSSATDTGLIVIIAMGEDNAATFGVNSVVVNGVTFTEVVDEDGSGIVDAALYRGPIEMRGGTLAT